jgi:hypothetical protein
LSNTGREQKEVGKESLSFEKESLKPGALGSGLRSKKFLTFISPSEIDHNKDDNGGVQISQHLGRSTLCCWKTRSLSTLSGRRSPETVLSRGAGAEKKV